MEKICHVCNHGEEDNQKETEITVLLICDSCLKNENLSPFLDEIFLN